ncbi:MAG: TraR/DksA C4-type zinc finger protein [Desulfuromonadaceae bacterium]|nr:TraR/DksA C4-type zinc finger protein [Desulfuromonadaceae bacterium]
MVTKSKAKSETTPEATSRPDSESTPKITSKVAPKITPVTPAKDNKTTAVITAVASKSVESPKPKGKQSPKEDSASSAKPAQKPVPKAAPSIAPKIQKWHEIRAILEKIKEDTLREISKSVRNGTDAVATNEPGGDIYDQASSERDRELGLLLGDREREKLHSIDEALIRIDEGEYGICEECDEDIPLGRLKAMPFARHCVKCKSDLEKLQAQTRRFEEDRAYREIPLGSEEEEA